MSLTGSNADKRIQIKPSQEAAVLLNLYNEIGNKTKWNNNHVEHGHLTIDKSSSSTNISSSGALELLDRYSPLVHFTFEGVVPLEERQVLGMIHDDFDDKLVGTSITIRGATCTESMPNEGSFGRK